MSSRVQTVGPATGKARGRPYVLSRQRGTMSRCRLAERTTADMYRLHSVCTTPCIKKLSENWPASCRGWGSVSALWRCSLHWWPLLLFALAARTGASPTTSSRQVRVTHRTGWFLSPRRRLTSESRHPRTPARCHGDVYVSADSRATTHQSLSESVRSRQPASPRPTRLHQQCQKHQQWNLLKIFIHQRMVETITN